MREKELRLALICYGGISLAIYMHGITKEIWNISRASATFGDDNAVLSGSMAVYSDLLHTIASKAQTRIRIIPDIVAGASAGGINGIFLAQAIQSGQSLDPLTDLWLENADVDRLLDPDARPAARATKFWASPIAWLALRKSDASVDQTVAPETRSEVRAKLSRFVRSRWFAPPFGGTIFSRFLLEALDAMAASKKGPPLLPPDHPLDLMVTVTDFEGYPEVLRLNSPPNVIETEHRLTVGFRSSKRSAPLADIAELLFAARATASFPGAFPPLQTAEIDGLLGALGREWPGRDAFLARIMPRRATLGTLDQAALIDGSVLTNAPFAPAIEVLRNRPSRREVDRRFVYIDPRPKADAPRFDGGTENVSTSVPGFFRAILGSLTDIPREQPIRDNLDSIFHRSREIRRMRRITDALRGEVEAQIETVLGRTILKLRPTPKRLAAWRTKAQQRAGLASGFAYSAYAHVKLSAVVEELAELLGRLGKVTDSSALEVLRQTVWRHVRERKLDVMERRGKESIGAHVVEFFRTHDYGYRIRRLRFVVRRLSELAEGAEAHQREQINAARDALYAALASYQVCETIEHYDAVAISAASKASTDIDNAIAEIARNRDLVALDAKTDELVASALGTLTPDIRQAILRAYLGFPFYDVATFPLLQGEGMDEYDPIKVDRISPEDCSAIRSGGAEATLRGIEFNNFGAFFSRAYRENDYLWGRLHGAERMIDILLSTIKRAPEITAGLRLDFMHRAFAAILEEEEARLPTTRALIASIRQEMRDRRAKP